MFKNFKCDFKKMCAAKTISRIRLTGFEIVHTFTVEDILDMMRVVQVLSQLLLKAMCNLVTALTISLLSSPERDMSMSNKISIMNLLHCMYHGVYL